MRRNDDDADDFVAPPPPALVVMPLPPLTSSCCCGSSRKSPPSTAAAAARRGNDDDDAGEQQFTAPYKSELGALGTNAIWEGSSGMLLGCCRVPMPTAAMVRVLLGVGRVIVTIDAHDDVHMLLCRKIWRGLLHQFPPEEDMHGIVGGRLSLAESFEIFWREHSSVPYTYYLL